MRRTKNTLKTAVILTLAVIIMLKPSYAVDGARRGISMCFDTVIPSLFLFAVLSETAYGLGAFSSGAVGTFGARALNIPPTCMCAVIFSFIGGYPVGVRLIKQEFEKNRIDFSSARRLISFCVNAGPGFIINTVGVTVLNSALSGTAVLFSAFLSSVITAVLLSFISKRKNKTPGRNKKPEIRESTDCVSFSDVFTSSVSSSANAMISISAWIILFSALENVMFSFVENENIKIWFRIIFEVTDGVSAAQKLGGAPMCAAAASFGGICVFMQIFPMLTKMKVRLRDYFIPRIFNAFLSFIICRAVTGIIPSAVETVKFAPPSASFSSYAVSNAVLLIASGVMIMSDSLTDVKILLKRRKST